MTPQTFTMGIEFDEPTKALIEGFRKLVERGETVAAELRNRLIPSSDNNGYTRIFTTDGRTTQGEAVFVREVTP